MLNYCGLSVEKRRSFKDNIIKSHLDLCVAVLEFVTVEMLVTEYAEMPGPTVSKFSPYIPNLVG